MSWKKDYIYQDKDGQFKLLQNATRIGGFMAGDGGIVPAEHVLPEQRFAHQPIFRRPPEEEIIYYSWARSGYQGTSVASRNRIKKSMIGEEDNKKIKLTYSYVGNGSYPFNDGMSGILRNWSDEARTYDSYEGMGIPYYGYPLILGKYLFFRWWNGDNDNPQERILYSKLSNSRLYTKEIKVAITFPTSDSIARGFTPLLIYKQNGNYTLWVYKVERGPSPSFRYGKYILDSFEIEDTPSVHPYPVEYVRKVFLNRTETGWTPGGSGNYQSNRVEDYYYTTIIEQYVSTNLEGSWSLSEPLEIPTSFFNSYQGDDTVYSPSPGNNADQLVLNNFGHKEDPSPGIVVNGIVHSIYQRISPGRHLLATALCKGSLRIGPTEFNAPSYYTPNDGYYSSIWVDYPPWVFESGSPLTGIGHPAYKARVQELAGIIKTVKQKDLFMSLRPNIPSILNHIIREAYAPPFLIQYEESDPFWGTMYKVIAGATNVLVSGKDGNVASGWRSAVNNWIVYSQQELDALTPQEGDIALRMDLNTSYIRKGGFWQTLQYFVKQLGDGIIKKTEIESVSY